MQLWRFETLEITHGEFAWFYVQRDTRMGPPFCFVIGTPRIGKSAVRPRARVFRSPRMVETLSMDPITASHAYISVRAETSGLERCRITPSWIFVIQTP